MATPLYTALACEQSKRICSKDFCGHGNRGCWGLLNPVDVVRRNKPGNSLDGNGGENEATVNDLST